MSEVHRLMIMGSSIEDAIAAVLALNLAPPGGSTVKLTPAGSSNRPKEPTPVSRQDQEMPPPPTPIAERVQPKEARRVMTPPQRLSLLGGEVQGSLP
eukprot:2294127-Amphidinium_carterae.1